MTDRPFLLLSIRAEDAAAEDEYAAVLRFTGLPPASLRRVRLDRTDLGDVELDALSGIILGGGAYNVSDPEPSKSADQRRAESSLARLLDDVIARDFPFLGCCYGIGVVGRHVGATLGPAHAEPVGPVTVTLTGAGRTDPLLAGLPPSFDAFVGHKEGIDELPAGVTLLASSGSCPVQAFRVGENVYATQFHPELDVEGICTRIAVYRHHGYFPPDEAEALQQAMRRSAVVHPPTILRTFVQAHARPSPDG
jgi:GMP synthase (glutamine-hydrolysing)